MNSQSGFGKSAVAVRLRCRAVGIDLPRALQGAEPLRVADPRSGARLCEAQQFAQPGDSGITSGNRPGVRLMDLLALLQTRNSKHETRN